MVQVGRLELALCELAARQDGDRVGRNKPIVTNELCPHPRQQRRVRHVQDAGERHHDACDGTHEPHERKTPHGENAPLNRYFCSGYKISDSTGTGVTAFVGATSPSAELFLEEFHLCGSQNFSDRSLKRFSPGVQLLAHVSTNLTELLALRLEQCFKALGLFITKIERGSQSAKHPTWRTPLIPNK